MTIPVKRDRGAQRANRIDQLRDTIERMILNGDIPAGEHLNENALAQQFNVSRGPVREAVRGLEQAGLVRIIPNRGVFVRLVSMEETLDLYDVRAGLARAAGRLLARRVTDAQIAELETLHESMENVRQAGDSQRYTELSETFHHKLMLFSGNTRLAALAQNVEKELRLLHRRSMRGPDRLRHSNQHHARILEALRSHDEEATATAFENDILHGKRLMLESLA